MRADVVIVGGGLAGSAAAWELSRRGRDVVLFEAFEPGHQRGSSHGSARIFRRAYPDPLYVSLTGAARRRWRELEDEAGEELVRTTGAIDFGPPPNPEKMYQIMAAQQVPAKLLTPAEAAERWPGIAFDDDHPVLFHPEAGVIDADRAVAAMQRLAIDRGADVRHATPVIAIDAGAPRAGRGALAGTVRTGDETFSAPVVVVAAGAWLVPLLGGLVPLPRLEVTQLQTFHLMPVMEIPNERADATMPVWMYHDDPVIYGLPSGSDCPGAVKVGVHGHGTVTTGDDRDGVVNPVVREEVRQFVQAKIPGLSPAPVAELTCLYTSTASEDFVLDRRGPLVVASACSGHGAKFAPLVGQILADLTDGEAPAHDRFTLAAHLGRRI